MFDSIGFIGAGRITRIMLNGWQNTGVDLPPVYVFDQSPEAINSLSEFFLKYSQQVCQRLHLNHWSLLHCIHQ